LPKTVQFTVGLDNAAGTLAKLCALLRKSRVNIEAICVADNADCGWVRLIATPAARARAVLERHRYTVIARLVVTVTAENRPGELERLASALARAGVNVHYVYGSTVKGAASTLVFGVSDVDRALKAIGE
jgi:hypothetical protein